jgi:hypothetical protein
MLNGWLGLSRIPGKSTTVGFHPSSVRLSAIMGIILYRHSSAYVLLRVRRCGLDYGFLAIAPDAVEKVAWKERMK